MHILATKRNSGTYTYDGIELGGERVAYEIEETLEALEAQEGCKIRKLSVVGYSLGGLVSRYALGLLEARGWLDRLEPVNFTTFAAPHVGVRTPMRGIIYSMWNILGARTVSMSGRQLFMIDSFRDTGKPLLSVLADPDTIFMRALARFKHRCLYSNIVNDRTAVFYTTCISDTDPFNDVDLEQVHLNYVEGYEPVVIDPDEYFLPITSSSSSASTTNNHTAKVPPSSKKTRVTKILSNVPLWISLSFLMPITLVLFLLNSVVQNFRSRRRIHLHGQGGTGALFGTYKVPLIIQDVRDAVEDAIETANPVQELVLSDDDSESDAEFLPKKEIPKDRTMSPSLLTQPAANNDEQHARLALTPAQFDIIDSLNTVGFRKYPVFIHNTGHSHAAMIVRIRGQKYEEGKIVVKHWLDHEFKV